MIPFDRAWRRPRTGVPAGSRAVARLWSRSASRRSEYLTLGAAFVLLVGLVAVAAGLVEPELTTSKSAGDRSGAVAAGTAVVHGSPMLQAAASHIRPWTVLSDGRLFALAGTGCITPVDHGTTAGTVVGVSACVTADSTQIWQSQSDKTIVNTAPGLCLTAGSLGYTSPYTLQPCTATTNQQWVLPTS